MRKIPVILTAIYLGLVLLSIIPIFTGDDPLSGVFAIILTAPWSLLLDDQLPGNLVTGLVAVADTHLQPIETAAAAPDFRDFLLQKHNLHSQLVFPIHLHGQWWGTLTMNEWGDELAGADAAPKHPDPGADRPVRWTEDEILLLGTAVEMLTSTLQRWQAEDQLRGLNNRLEQQVEGRTAKLHDTVTRLRQEVKDRQRAETALQEMMTSLEQRLADRTEELATFFDLTVLAGQAVTMAGVFEQVLPRIAEVTRSRAICIHLLDADQSSLELTAQFNLPAQVGSGLQQVTLSPAFQNWLRQPNDPLTTTRLSSLENLPPVLQLSEYQTYLGSQIRVSTQAEGLLSCYRFTDRGFSLDEIALVTALAEQIGMMLEIHRLRQKAEEMAVLAERQRLARDLHDSLTQSLYSLSLFSRAGREAVEDGDKARLESSLTQLETNTLHALREMRLLLYELRPADLEQEGLTRALELRLNTVEQRVGLQLDIHLDDLPDLPPGFEAELYHLIVEALNNVVKHASATRLTVHLTLHPTETEPELHLLVADNGQGFDPAQTSGGLGLKNMRERVSRLGGCLTIDSRPNHGTRLEAVMPYLRETA